MPPILLRSFAFLPLLAPLAAQSTRVAPPTPEDILPASSYAAMRFGGLAACRQAAAAMPAAAAVQSFLARVPAELRAEHLDAGLDRAAQQLQDGLAPLGLRPADLRAALARPMTVAIGRLSIAGMGPSVALVVDVGEQKKAVDRLVQWAAQQIASRTGGAEFDEADIGGRPFHSMQLKNGLSLFSGMVDNLLVVSNSRGYLREMVEVAAGKQKSLRESSRLGQLAAQLPAPALASMFVNAQRVLASFAPHLPYEADAWASALGIGAIDAVYLGYAATGAGGSDLLHVGVGGSEHGVLKALLAQPADLSFAKACSANTVMFAAGSLDAEGVLQAMDGFANLLPAAWREQMMRTLQRGPGRELERAGAPFERVHSILRAFGTQVGVAVALEKGAVPKPELIARIAVRDPEVVRSHLQHLEQMMAQQGQLEWKSRKAGEVEVRFCNLPLPEAKLQLSPCFAVSKDALWIGSDVMALVRALGQDEAQSLAAQPDFADVARANQGASGVMHWRLFRAAEIGWRSVETMAYPLLDNHKDEIGFGSEALPDAETVAKALGSCTWTYRVDDDGVAMQSQGTFTSGSLLAALGLLGDEVLARASARLF